MEEEPARGRRQVVIVEEPAEDDVHVQVVNDEIDIQQVRDEDRQIIRESDDLGQSFKLEISAPSQEENNHVMIETQITTEISEPEKVQEPLIPVSNPAPIAGLINEGPEEKKEAVVEDVVPRVVYFRN